MSAPYYTTLVAEFMNKMDAMTTSFLTTNYQALATYMAAPIAALSTLYIIIQGYLINAGVVQTNTNSFLKMAFTIGLINMFALNWLYFSDYFVGLFLHCASSISHVVATSSFHVPPAFDSGSGVNDALQTVLTESVNTGVEIMKQGSYRNWAPLFIGWNFILGGTAVVGFALIEVALIKFCLCMLLSMGPLFIAFCFFEQTKGFYKAWIGFLSGFSFALIFSGLMVGMAMNWMHWVVGSGQGTDAIDLKIATLVPLAFVVLLSFFLLFIVIPIAKHIGGASGGAHTGDALKQSKSLANKTVQGAKGAQQLYNQWKNR
ncbi:type IV secretion system protein [Legionella sp.]|uniref:type IV secretion system protein n=1 Tax=Legionella sp. TaxID=459 RepID=UPI003C91C5AB